MSIAHVLLRYGYRVVLTDSSPGLLTQGGERIHKGLARDVEKVRPTAGFNAKLVETLAGLETSPFTVDAAEKPVLYGAWLRWRSFASSWTAITGSSMNEA